MTITGEVTTQEQAFIWLDSILVKYQSKMRRVVTQIKKGEITVDVITIDQCGLTANLDKLSRKNPPAFTPEEVVNTKLWQFGNSAFVKEHGIIRTISYDDKQKLWFLTLTPSKKS